MLLATMLAAAIFIAMLQEKRVQDRQNYDNAQWTLAQAEVEYLRLGAALESTLRRPSRESLSALGLRFDIFAGRIDLLNVGHMGSLLAAHPDHHARVAKVTVMVEKAGRALESIRARPDSEAGNAIDLPAIERLGAILAPAQPIMHEISLDALHLVVDEAAAQS